MFMQYSKGPLSCKTTVAALTMALLCIATEICTFLSCFIHWIKSQYNTCFLLNKTTTVYSQFFKIMDVTIKNINYVPTCLACTCQLLITYNFGKTWSFFRRNIIDVFSLLKGTICYPKSQKRPNITVISWRKTLMRSCTNIWQDSLCSKAPVCLAKHHGKIWSFAVAAHCMNIHL